jgi:hypothetical protein
MLPIKVVKGVYRVLKNPTPASVGKDHLLARASHGLVRGCPKGSRLVSTKAEDNGERWRRTCRAKSGGGA